MNQENKNIPYVKEYDADGKLTNPIEKRFTNPFPNRAERRAELTSKPFKGNKKGISLTVVNNGMGSIKYERVQQLVPAKTEYVNDGYGKSVAVHYPQRTINHYKQR